MSGLEKIIRQIEAEAQAQADELLRSAGSEADKIRAELKAKCDQELGQIEEKSTRDIADCNSRGASAVEQQRRLALLQTKQEIITDVMAKALAALQAKPAAEYFAAVLKLAERYARGQAGQILFAQEDLDRMDADFADKLNEAAKKKGGSLTIGADPRSTGGGFVLVYGGIEENCTFPALFDARREELQDLIHRLLFA